MGADGTLASVCSKTTPTGNALLDHVSVVAQDFLHVHGGVADVDTLEVGLGVGRFGDDNELDST